MKETSDVFVGVLAASVAIFFGIITDHRIEPQYDLSNGKVRFNIRRRIMRSGSATGGAAGQSKKKGPK